MVHTKGNLSEIGSWHPIYKNCTVLNRWIEFYAVDIVSIGVGVTRQRRKAQRKEVR